MKLNLELCSHKKKKILFLLFLPSLSSSPFPPFPANHSLSARANRVGLSVLKIWTQSKSSAPVADYISVVVGDVISPALNNLVVGDVVCLSSPLQTGASEGSGHWSIGGAASSSSSPLKLYSSGLAVAVRPGAESLYHVVGSGQYTLTGTKVAASSGVVLKPTPSDTTPLSNVGGADSVSVVVSLGKSSSLKSALTPECKAELSHIALPGPKFSFPTLFLCRLSFYSTSGATTISPQGISAQQLFSAASSFDAESGTHRCVVKAKQLVDSDPILEDVSKIDSDILLTVSSSVDDDLVVSDPVVIPYVAPLYLATSGLPLALSAGETASILLSASASAASSVEVTSTLPQTLAVEAAIGADSVVQISVTAGEDAQVDEDFTAQILIQSSLTGSIAL